MKISDTISVNPGKTTLGHVEKNTSLFRSNILNDDQVSQPLNLTNVLFPTIGAGVTEYKKYSLPLRALMATILIVTGISVLSSTLINYSVGFAICSLCFGGLLALGLLTRPVMAGAAVFYCISGALSLRSGMADISTFSLMFGCLIFTIIGSGKYSCDYLIRSAVKRFNRNKALKDNENRMGYKAFHYAKY